MNTVDKMKNDVKKAVDAAEKRCILTGFFVRCRNSCPLGGDVPQNFGKEKTTLSTTFPENHTW